MDNFYHNSNFWMKMKKEIIEAISIVIVILTLGTISFETGISALILILQNPLYLAPYIFTICLSAIYTFFVVFRRNKKIKIINILE